MFPSLSYNPSGKCSSEVKLLFWCGGIVSKSQFFVPFMLFLNIPKLGYPSLYVWYIQIHYMHPNFRQLYFWLPARNCICSRLNSVGDGVGGSTILSHKINTAKSFQLVQIRPYKQINTKLLFILYRTWKCHFYQNTIEFVNDFFFSYVFRPFRNSFHMS